MKGRFLHNAHGSKHVWYISHNSPSLLPNIFLYVFFPMHILSLQSAKPLVICLGFPVLGLRTFSFRERRLVS
ncbi:hypothetical protein MPTK1_8g02410 [Marchantia polymorpha subsp. ruderalis]|uniref:Uncharacterized protein n=1 Tax=Marchantia polymorpha TaxID=3197 RepID=A0A2R6XJ36_MARPO|nr:hypothetical protein MARPO_0012s0038 [Marchantia polymorpha]BBN18429.1 hypothetical protein Mp_8g02410 [Marchantia polymorpha subsp. ruderalis]|eukprot:PTQ46076.1 hypothetical protein MARPO_0012s0038 [Marchantia polymorpha]